MVFAVQNWCAHCCSFVILDYVYKKDSGCTEIENETDTKPFASRFQRAKVAGKR